MERRFQDAYRRIWVSHNENCLQVVLFPTGHGQYSIVTRWRTPIVAHGTVDLDLIERVIRSGESNAR